MVNYDEQRKQGYRERFQTARRKQARWIALIVAFLLFLLILWGLSVLWPSAQGVWSILAMLAAFAMAGFPFPVLCRFAEINCQIALHNDLLPGV